MTKHNDNDLTPAEMRRKAEYYMDLAAATEEAIAVANALRFWGLPEWADRVRPGAATTVIIPTADDVAPPPEDVLKIVREAVADHRTTTTHRRQAVQHG